MVDVEELFFNTIERGNIWYVKRYIIRRNIDINASKKSTSALSIALKLNHSGLARWMVRYGADVNNFDCQPIVDAMLGQNYNMVKFLINHGANIELSKYSCSLLHLAVEQNSDKMVIFFLEKNLDVNIHLDYQGTPLVEACSNPKNLSIVKIFLGVPFIWINNITGPRCYTPLLRAMGIGHLKMVDYLISKGARIISQEIKKKESDEIIEDCMFNYVRLKQGTLKLKHIILNLVEDEIYSKRNKEFEKVCNILPPFLFLR